MKSFDKAWEEIHATQEWGQYPSEPVIRFVARNYYQRNRAEVKILDFGCGGGSHTWYLVSSVRLFEPALCRLFEANFAIR